MTDNKGYHAHVYYNAETKAKAAALREALAGKFKVEAGALSDEPRGPHPVPQFAVIFETPEFDTVVFSAPVNEVQGPVRTQFGYHLIEVTSRA